MLYLNFGVALREGTSGYMSLGHVILDGYPLVHFEQAVFILEVNDEKNRCCGNNHRRPSEGARS